MSKARVHDSGEESDIDNDLKFLNEMNIDQDFNIWSDFRNSLSVSQRHDLRRMSIRQSSIRQSSDGSININDSSRSRLCMESMTEIEVIKDDNLPAEIRIDETDTKYVTDKDYPGLNAFKKRASSLKVAFSSLSIAERRDIRSWNMRLVREPVFSRYYFPEEWELREMKMIKKELKLTDSSFQGYGEGLPESTKKTMQALFFPGDHDPKSVLLKRGPILVNGAEERELLLFTHGFVLIRVEFDSLINLLFDMNAAKYQTKELTTHQLHERFNSIDSDGNGELDRFNFREIFLSMGIPIGENVLSKLMERFDLDKDGAVTFKEFEQVMGDFTPKNHVKDNSSFLASVGKKLKKVLIPSDVERKLDLAFSLSNIEKVESLTVCCSAETYMLANSSLADITFTIFMRGISQPLVMVCSKPEQREAWVDAFRTCIVNSIKFGSDSRIPDNHTNKIGWQHNLIRDSLHSLVVCNDCKRLSEYLSQPTSDNVINDHDMHYGYTALHYAAILNHLECATILLASGAEVNCEDDEKKTPMDHAKDMDMIRLLEKNGGKKMFQAMQGLLYQAAFEEQKQKSIRKSQNSNNKMRLQARGAANSISQAMLQMRLRGEKLETLELKSLKIQNDAADFASMAKKLREKQKKSASSSFLSKHIT